MVLEAEPDKISIFKQWFSVIIFAANILVFIWQMMEEQCKMCDKWCKNNANNMTHDRGTIQDIWHMI